MLKLDEPRSLKKHHHEKLHKHIAGDGDVDDVIKKAEPDFEKHKADHSLFKVDTVETTCKNRVQLDRGRRS
jgi:signal recognition particle GTPase